MNQIFDAWRAYMARYIQTLDGGSVAGYSLPSRTKLQEDVLKRHFRHQGIRGVEYTKETRRDQPDAAAGGITEGKMGVETKRGI
jgi:hypothetical protein